jgi:hypothetical protein
MRQVHGDEASAKAVASFLNPGGILFSLCGNANEPACGPPVLRGMSACRLSFVLFTFLCEGIAFSLASFLPRML